MRPDIEDFEELTVADETPRSRAMSWVVLAVAVGGFGALAYYAYHSGTQSMQNGDVLVVQADETPIKQVPTDAEGEQFANQDKTIYDVIAPNTAESKVEKLLPEPEKPVAAPQEAAVATPAPTTFVNKNITGAATPVEAQPAKQPEPVKQAEAAKPAPLVVPVPSSAVALSTAAKKVTSAPVPQVTEVKKVEPKVAAAAPKTEPKAVEVSPHVEMASDVENETAGEPTFVNESPVVESKVAVKHATPEVKKPEAKPAKETKAATSGAYQIQLGAFKSDDEARSHWKKVASQFSGIVSGEPFVIKADLPNGTFYRLRAGSYASGDAAKAACAKLSAKGQACFPVAK